MVLTKWQGSGVVDAVKIYHCHYYLVYKCVFVAARLITVKYEAHQRWCNMGINDISVYKHRVALYCIVLWHSILNKVYYIALYCTALYCIALSATFKQHCCVLTPTKMIGKRKNQYIFLHIERKGTIRRRESL